MVAVEKLRPLFANLNLEVLPLRVTVGFNKGKHAKSTTYLGWQTEDGIPQIFISPELTDVAGPSGILAHLAHECIHVVNGYLNEHRQFFARVAGDLGFLRPYGTPNAGPVLANEFKKIEEVLGKYPHSAIVLKPRLDKYRHNVMLGVQCKQCGYRALVSPKWANVGLPHCPLHGRMELKPKKS